MMAHPWPPPSKRKPPRGRKMFGKMMFLAVLVLVGLIAYDIIKGL